SLVDERFTTVVAHQALHSSGREMKKHREVVDQAAAVEILQQSLNVERHRGKVPGVAVCSQSLIQGANLFDDGCHDGTEATGRCTINSCLSSLKIAAALMAEAIRLSRGEEFLRLRLRGFQPVRRCVRSGANANRSVVANVVVESHVSLFCYWRWVLSGEQPGSL